MASLNWQKKYLDHYYSKDRGWVDGTTEFHLLCKEEIPLGAKILEIGAGPTNPTSKYLSLLGELHGVDIDPEIKLNKTLLSAHIISNDSYPFDDNNFDVCISNYVLEHVTNPQQHLQEVSRVLKPGGVYIFRTPNLWHYVSIISKFTSHQFHLLVANKVRNLSTDNHDPYPTVYALNTRSSISRHAKTSNLTIKSIKMVEKEPSYGMKSRLLFFPFMWYERLVNSTEKLAYFRSNLFVILQKNL